MPRPPRSAARAGARRVPGRETGRTRRHILPALALVIAAASAVGADTPYRLRHTGDIPSGCNELTMTMREDTGGRDVLYVAAKEGGLRIYDIAAAPRLLRQIPTADLQALDVMSLSQAGARLYLALGNHFSDRQAAGVAVVDITEPAAARVVDVWTDAHLRGGAGAVAAADGRVYLGAMRHGLVILDSFGDGRLRERARLLPVLDYPDARPDPRKYNARGLVVRDGTVYLAFDAGGLRIIDVTDPDRPRETGRYANPALLGKPRAYNNLVLDGDLAYVAVDYCGLEILNIADPGAIRLVGWWNPVQCERSAWKWFTSPVHANEIALDRACDQVFLSAGRSDLQVVSVADPARPALRLAYGGVDNGIGTWGVSKQGQRVYLSYICTLGIPFRSRWSGVSLLETEGDCAAP
ncbi:MAG: hypothetical protein R3F42_09770 [Pseudomonadota bacterium]